MDDIKIKSAFDTIHISADDMKTRVSKSIQSKNKPARIRKSRAMALACVCLLTIGILSQGAIVFAKEVVIPWTKTITVEDKEIEIEGGYLNLNKDANTNDAKYDTIKDIENILGIDLLESQTAYESSKGMINYIPYKEGNKMLGAILKDYQYSLGDLKYVIIKSYPNDVSTISSMKCKNGEKYKSAISFEIVIRSDIEPSEKYENEELQYSPEDWYFSSGHGEEIYENSLSVPILIYNCEIDWGPNQSYDAGDKLIPATFAQFAYNGVEYIYHGAVSKDTMKKFIDTLH